MYPYPNMRNTNYRRPRYIPSLSNSLKMAPFAYQGLKYALNYYNRPPATVSTKSLPARKKKKKKQNKSKKLNIKKDVRQMKNQLHKLKQMDDNTTGTMTFRKLASGDVISAVNHNKVQVKGIIDNDLYEEALAQCKFFDPATPGTLVTGSAATGTFARNSLIQSVTNKLFFRNNYQVSCDITVYLCTVKDDTDILPNVLWTSGIADQGYGNLLTSNSDLGQYPTDYDLVKDIWNLKIAFKGTLEPGQTTTVSNTIKDIEYSSSTVDAHNLSYQREYKSQCYMIVVRGALAHDTIASETTFTQGGVDYFSQITMKVKYNAGIDLSYIYVQADNDPSFTNGAVCSNNPVVDNQNYSKT